MTDVLQWTWVFLNNAKEPVEASLSPTPFGAQVDAEAWIGEHYEQLVDEGVDFVELKHGNDTTYTMSLHPESL